MHWIYSRVSGVWLFICFWYFNYSFKYCWNFVSTNTKSCILYIVQICRNNLKFWLHQRSFNLWIALTIFHTYVFMYVTYLDIGGKGGYWGKFQVLSYTQLHNYIFSNITIGCASTLRSLASFRLTGSTRSFTHFLLETFN